MNFINEHKKEILQLLVMIFLMIIICLILYQPMMHFFENPQIIKNSLQSLGFKGQAVLTSIMILQVIFVFLPGEIVEVMAGFIYGPIGGMILCMIGSCIGSILIYLFVKRFGVSFIDRLIGKDKIKQIKFLNDPERRNILCFILFFIPGTPKDILTYCIP